MAQARRSIAPLTGAVFAVLYVGSFMIGGDVPDIEESSQEIVSFYDDNEGQQLIGTILLSLSAVFLLFFTSSLRSVLRSAEEDSGVLSTAAFGGGVVAATGLLISAGLTFAVVEAAKEVDQPTAAQTLHALSLNLFFPLAGGIVTLLVATGLASISTKAVPLWLGLAGLVIAVAVFTPLGFFGFLASIAWVLVTSIVLWVGTAVAPAPGAGPEQPIPR